MGELARWAVSEARSTSPAAVVEGRLRVTLVPQLEAVVMLAPEGRALSAGPAPESVRPSRSAVARSGIRLRTRRTTDGVVMFPLWSGQAGGFRSVLRGERERRARLGTGPTPYASWPLALGEDALIHPRSAESWLNRSESICQQWDRSGADVVSSTTIFEAVGTCSPRLGRFDSGAAPCNSSQSSIGSQLARTSSRRGDMAAPQKRARRMVSAGSRVPIVAHVHLGRRPVRGVRVYLVGPRLSPVRTTEPPGRALFVLDLQRPGILTLRIRRPFLCPGPIRTGSGSSASASRR